MYRHSNWRVCMYITDPRMYITESGVYITDSGVYITDSGVYVTDHVDRTDGGTSGQKHPGYRSDATSKHCTLVSTRRNKLLAYGPVNCPKQFSCPFSSALLLSARSRRALAHTARTRCCDVEQTLVGREWTPTEMYQETWRPACAPLMKHCLFYVRKHLHF